MTRIECPYCDTPMAYRELGFVAKTSFYECPRCLSRSPQTFGQINAKNIAKNAKKRLYRRLQMSDLGFPTKGMEVAKNAV